MEVGSDSSLMRLWECVIGFLEMRLRGVVRIVQSELLQVLDY